ncbi:MAG: cyclase family protein [Armatimonadota bacterium]
MRLVDLTHTTHSDGKMSTPIQVLVRSTQPIHLIPLERLVTLATVVDVRDSLADGQVVRASFGATGISDIAGCIMRSDWCDIILGGTRAEPPVLSVEAAVYLLEGGVRTIASDFPLAGVASDLLLDNGCVLVHCLSGISKLRHRIVRLIALPLKLEGRFSAEARVIAIEEE